MLFSFIHAADVHLDSPLRGLVRRGDTARPFVEATRRAFDTMISMAIERSVAFLLISGDLYDGDWRDWASGHHVVRQFSRLDRAGIPVFLIRGNHDAESLMSRSLPYPKNVVELSVRSVQSVRLEAIGVVIHGRGFANRHVEENVVGAYPHATSGLFNVGMLHTSMTGRDGHGSYAPCSLSDLASKGYDYWALGHIHQREIVSEAPYVVFPGNLQGRHAKETGPKGCTLVTVEDGRIAAVEALVCDVARFETTKVELAGAIDQAEFDDRVTEVVREAYDSTEGRPLALRVSLVGSTPLQERIAASPTTIGEQIQSLAWRVSDTILIEKVEDHTTHPSAAVRQPVPHFQEILDEVANDPAFLSGLDAVIGDLRAKLPPEALALMDGEAQREHVTEAVVAASRTVAALLGEGASS